MRIRKFTSIEMEEETAKKITEALKTNDGNRVNSSKELEISIRGMRMAINVIREKFPELYKKIPEAKNCLPNCLRHY